MERERAEGKGRGRDRPPLHEFLNLPLQVYGKQSLVQFILVRRPRSASYSTTLAVPCQPTHLQRPGAYGAARRDRHSPRILTDACFPALRIRCRDRCRNRCRIRSRCRSRFRKNRVRTCSLCRCCWGVCAAIARQAQEAGRRIFRAKEWAELQERTNGRYGKMEHDPI